MIAPNTSRITSSAKGCNRLRKFTLTSELSTQLPVPSTQKKGLRTGNCYWVLDELGTDNCYQLEYAVPSLLTWSEPLRQPTMPGCVWSMDLSESS